MTPSFRHVLSALAALFLGLSVANAETHTITFDNQCGRGTPTLIVDGKVVSTGAPYTSTGTISGIAYLQTGECLFNGENCSLLEMTLTNPASGCIGCGSSADISLIAPHKFNVVSGYSFYNGCDGQGHTCASATCKDAFFQPNDNQVQTGCQADNRCVG
ncbi:glycopeptide [Irpex rosettiformis]|uniref:Glycopeptide n=1 Tax=Irpex rosettiformis TaxID=378272 RepID=A0ACB8U1B1_9APHY|nr:glycopeptide [Irpex rosettiformis]